MRIIAGKYKNREILSAKDLGTRPTSSMMRETLFNIVQADVEGARFLDLFAGFGAMGLEALSRGASYAAFVDESRVAVDTIKKSVQRIGIQEPIACYTGDCLAVLKRLRADPFTIIYIDPPYGDDKESLARGILLELDGSALFADGARIFVEESRLFEALIPDLSSIHYKKSRRAGRSTLYEFIASART